MIKVKDVSRLKEFGAKEENGFFIKSIGKTFKDSFNIACKVYLIVDRHNFVDLVFGYDTANFTPCNDSVDCHFIELSDIFELFEAGLIENVNLCK